MAVADDRDPDGFTVVRHGYDRTQVRQRVAELAEAAEKASTERDEAREQVAELHGELEIARREVAALTERLEAKADEESSTRLLAVAKSQAAEVTSRARVAADQMWAAAEEASRSMRDRYRALLASLDEQHTELARTHKSMMASTKTQVEQMTTEAERRREAIDKDAEQDRIRIDREFSESMTTKREALRREVEEAKAACDREISERLAEATSEAQRRVETVTEQVQRLTSVRNQLNERLRDTKELLDLSTSLLEPVEGEAVAVPDEPEEPAKEDDVSPSDMPTKRTVPPQRATKRQPAAKG
jgi:chromosome segregation ATPase